MGTSRAHWAEVRLIGGHKGKCGGALSFERGAPKGNRGGLWRLDWFWKRDDQAVSWAGVRTKENGKRTLRENLTGIGGAYGTRVRSTQTQVVEGGVVHAKRREVCRQSCNWGLEPRLE